MNFTPENGSTLQVVVVGENRIGTEQMTVSAQHTWTLGESPFQAQMCAEAETRDFTQRIRLIRGVRCSCAIAVGPTTNFWLI